MKLPTLTPRRPSSRFMYCATDSHSTSTVPSTFIGIASTYERNSATRFAVPGLIGASPSEQLPKTTVVAPCCGENEHSGSHVTCASKWVWLSTNPGEITRPAASIVSFAGPESLPISTILPFSTPTSPRNAGIPEPSTTRPFLISRSYPIVISSPKAVHDNRILRKSLRRPGLLGHQFVDRFMARVHGNTREP